MCFFIDSGIVLDLALVFVGDFSLTTFSSFFPSFCGNLGGAGSGRSIGMSSVEPILNCRRK